MTALVQVGVTNREADGGIMVVLQTKVTNYKAYLLPSYLPNGCGKKVLKYNELDMNNESTTKRNQIGGDLRKMRLD